MNIHQEEQFAVNNVYLYEATDSIQYHPPNANLDCDWQMVSIFTVYGVSQENLQPVSPQPRNNILTMVDVLK